MSTPKVTTSDPPLLSSFVDEEPIDPLSINKYDPYQLKSKIDDLIIQLLDEMKWEEDNTSIDYKIVVTAIACAVTAFS